MLFFSRPKPNGRQSNAQPELSATEQCIASIIGNRAMHGQGLPASEQCIARITGDRAMHGQDYRGQSNASLGLPGTERCIARITGDRAMHRQDYRDRAMHLQDYRQQSNASPGLSATEQCIRRINSGSLIKPQQTTRFWKIQRQSHQWQVDEQIYFIGVR